ncbi:MAG TPA: nucleoside triphosphate pyrophosphohydrolase family protein [Terriglobia bacterium]|nr:nucleoside triphosphate pyrophosphohydrolase family protein [Terriglobia bacterium]
MTKEQRQVQEFMRLAGQEVKARPALAPVEVANLRLRLIEEEATELSEAMAAGDLVEIADAVGDLLYVVLGAASAYGIDLEPVFQEIHRSNLSKFIDGHRRPGGKWQKGPRYSPANLEPILAAQG